MLHKPDYKECISLKLSKVLDDIGISEEMVLKRRQGALLRETIMTISKRCGDNKVASYIFGSSSEGTTIQGHSDLDILTCNYEINVIQDLAEWKPGLINLLMVKDKTTFAGYCLLQYISEDVPLPAINVPYKGFVKDAGGRMLLKNNFLEWLRGDHYKHGPSWVTQGGPGIADSDSVPAFHCKSWPQEAKAWEERTGIGRWPTVDIKRAAVNSGCFLVPVGSKVGQNPVLEWRISTSQAERYLMFSLNITQIRCYVLMKMVVKTFFQHECEGQISSFMCKTVLFHCIEKTHLSLWQENKLLSCLTYCLADLWKCLKQENCPHFIIPGNNLMARQYSPEVKALFLGKLSNFLQNGGKALLQVEMHDLGQRMKTELSMSCKSVKKVQSKRDIYDCISGRILRETATTIITHFMHILPRTFRNEYETKEYLLKVLQDLKRFCEEGSQLEKKACSFLAPLACSTLATITTSLQPLTRNPISPEALNWFYEGSNSDVCSSRLKLATGFYKNGSMINAEAVLREIENKCAVNKVEPVCSCSYYRIRQERILFQKEAYHHDDKAVRTACAFCVRFTPPESSCVPQELLYERFRSTKDDRLQRRCNEYWMDWAVVDSVPYLHFLQYKTYGYLNKIDDAQRALANLAFTIEREYSLGHRETALNLLGQCMEQQNQPNKALLCYMKSLKVRDRNNVAKIHICRLLLNTLRA